MHYEKVREREREIGKGEIYEMVMKDIRETREMRKKGEMRERKERLTQLTQRKVNTKR